MVEKESSRQARNTHVRIASALITMKKRNSMPHVFHSPNLEEVCVSCIGICALCLEEMALGELADAAGICNRYPVRCLLQKTLAERRRECKCPRDD